MVRCFFVVFVRFLLVEGWNYCPSKRMCCRCLTLIIYPSTFWGCHSFINFLLHLWVLKSTQKDQTSLRFQQLLELLRMFNSLNSEGVGFMEAQGWEAMIPQVMIHVEPHWQNRGVFLCFPECYMSKTNFAIFLIRNQQSNEILYRNIYIYNIYIYMLSISTDILDKNHLVFLAKINVCFPPFPVSSTNLALPPLLAAGSNLEVFSQFQTLLIPSWRSVACGCVDGRNPANQLIWWLGWIDGFSAVCLVCFFRWRCLDYH